MSHRSHSIAKRPTVKQLPVQSSPIPSLLAEAIGAQQSGHLDEARRLYLQILKIDVHHADSLHLLGMTEYEVGHYQVAAKMICRAIAVNGKEAPYHSNLGIVLAAQGKLDEAVSEYMQALKFKPNSAETHNNLGIALMDQGKLEEAEAHYQLALNLNPDCAQTHNNLGIVLVDQGKLEEAKTHYQLAMKLKPDFAEAQNNMGTLLYNQSKLEEAKIYYKRAVDLKPDYANAQSNLGAVYYSQGKLEDANSHYRRALSLKPDYVPAHANLGDVLLNQGKLKEALACYELALKLKPDYKYLCGFHLFTEQQLCDWKNIESQRRYLVEHIDRNEKVVTPFISLAISGSPALQKRVAEIFVRNESSLHSTNAAIPHWPRHDRIRIGYYSADYYNHATCYLMADLFEQQDKSRFEILGFSFGPEVKDQMTERVSRAMDQFLDVRSLSDQEVAQLSQKLEVDIAVDLKGYTKNNRAGIFAARAAPIQVSYLGYPGTTAAGYMDYLIADETLIPKASQRYYSEKIVYLPGSYQANSRRPVSAKPCTRAEEGLPERGFVYCCFNNNYKIEPETFGIWMRILGQVEGSVLWLFEDNAEASDNLRKEAARCGISPERLIFAKRLPLAEHLARHRMADLFLDTLPCNAHTTASDALWAGLPVLTCMGEAFASRVAASLLHAIDLPELVTTTAADYEALAVQIATVPGRIQQIKEKLQRNRLTTTLFDLPASTRHLETAYSAMYERYQANFPPESFCVAKGSDTTGSPD